jgi:hypothetical protein
MFIARSVRGGTKPQRGEMEIPTGLKPAASIVHGEGHDAPLGLSNSHYGMRTCRVRAPGLQMSDFGWM